jgi:hypothetical protein
MINSRQEFNFVRAQEKLVSGDDEGVEPSAGHGEGDTYSRQVLVPTGRTGRSAVS